MDPFGPALATLPANQWSLFGPTSFQGYLDANHLGRVDTAAYISVDAIERLAPSLRQAEAIVLRLGVAEDSRKTQFAVIRTPGKLKEFFLHDDALPRSPATQYNPEGLEASVLPFTMFGKLTEKGMVNLGFASGAIGCALGLDPPWSLPIPATGGGTYSFTVSPHPEFPVEWHHNRGQVEIDAVFVGRRRGRDHLFVMETKATTERSLAKHKLVYPILALAPRVPAEMPIIPVYMRVQAGDKDVQYSITECRFPEPRKGPVCLSDLNANRCCDVRLCLA